MSKHDVVIIGAGPAGSAAAILCAQQGLRVALLEQSTVCRERPGETLPPGIEPLLEQLGIADEVLQGNFIRHAGNWVQWGAARHFSAFGGEPGKPWRGFQIPRRILDNLLLKKTQALGVTVVRPCRARKVIRKNTVVMGLETDNGVFHCSHVIDASGASGWLARRLALPRAVFSPRLLAMYGYARGASAVCDDAPGIIADQDGWCWIAKIGDDSYTWTRLNFDSRQATIIRAPSLFEHLHHVGGVRGADVTWRACQQCAGPGYFIVGDAASVLDPGTSHGVLKAIMSGMMAAHAVVNIRDHPMYHDTIQQQFRHWLNSWFVRDLEKMRELYAAHPASPRWLALNPVAAGQSFRLIQTRLMVFD
ncbi:NAD(P)/FAD-dependent oxidoreductase [Pseudomonas sp. NFX15]|uniref:NAD(P)/FAD-dependent oxidoreductase n=1 Tax=Pseudomonas sp. NFX15 TaxID=2816958 RepID=UPI003B8D3006